MSTSRFPSIPGYTRGHTKSFSYAQGTSATAPPPPPPSVPPQPTSFPSKGQDSADALAALNMLTEILREEVFLQSEEIRLADRPPERLAKLREAHKEWVVWRVRKELDKLRMWDRPAASSPTVEKGANKGDQARAAEEKRREEERRQQEEAARRDREREEKARERERTLKEERDRAAREREAQQQTRSRTPGGSTTTGPSFPWQRRFTSSSGAQQRSSSSASNAHPSSSHQTSSSHGYARADAHASGYGTDRESSRPFEAPPRSHTTAPFPSSNSAANREWNREALIAKSGWEAYQSRWNALNASASTTDSTTLRGLRFGDIPWPIFSNGPFSPADITSKTVGAFLLSPFHSVDKSTKERLRAALIQWHPDKFEARWLAAIADSEKPLVREGVGAVARAVNDLMAANR